MSAIIQNENAAKASVKEAPKGVKSTMGLKYKDLLLQSVKIGDDFMQHISGEMAVPSIQDAVWTVTTKFPTSGDSRSIVFNFEVMNFPINLETSYSLEFSVISSSEDWINTSTKIPFQSTFNAVQTCKISEDTEFTASLVVYKEENVLLKNLLESGQKPVEDKSASKTGDKSLKEKTAGSGPAALIEQPEDKDGKPAAHGKRSGDKADGKRSEDKADGKRSEDKADDKPAVHEGQTEKKAGGGEPAAEGAAGDNPVAEDEPEAKKSRTEQ